MINICRPQYPGRCLGSVRFILTVGCDCVSSSSTFFLALCSSAPVRTSPVSARFPPEHCVHDWAWVLARGQAVVWEAASWSLIWQPQPGGEEEVMASWGSGAMAGMWVVCEEARWWGRGRQLCFLPSVSVKMDAPDKEGAKSALIK